MAHAGKPSQSTPESGSPLGSPNAQSTEMDSESSHRTLGPKSQERSVPSTPIARFMGFANLGANLAAGALASSISNAWSGSSESSSRNGHAYNSILTEKNAETLAAGLCRMRGAALKIGQMLSIQDESVIPPQIHAALERVRAGADYMPRRQLETVLKVQHHWNGQPFRSE